MESKTLRRNVTPDLQTLKKKSDARSDKAGIVQDHHHKHERNKKNK
jgi:hypothetical protein